MTKFSGGGGIGVSRCMSQKNTWKVRWPQEITKKDHAGLRVAPLFLKANTKSILRTAPEFGMSQNLWLGSAFLEHI